MYIFTSRDIFPVQLSCNPLIFFLKFQQGFLHLVILKNAINDRTEYFEPVILDKLYFTCVCMDIKKCSISLVGYNS